MKLHEPADLPIGSGRDAFPRLRHLAIKLLSDGLPIQCHGVLFLLHHAGDDPGKPIPYSPNIFSGRSPLSTTNLLVRSRSVW